MNNWQEWICGTDPTDLDSVFRLVSAVPDETGVTVTWQSVAGVNYSLERMTHLDSSTGFELVAAGIPGKAARTSYSDTNAVPSIAAFYRVGVSGP